MIKIKIKGARGSGKTALASIIKNALACEGFDVNVSDGDMLGFYEDHSHKLPRIVDNQKIKIKVINKGD